MAARIINLTRLAGKPRLRMDLFLPLTAQRNLETLGLAATCIMAARKP
jgi:hypothetical protein